MFHKALSCASNTGTKIECSENSTERPLTENMSERMEFEKKKEPTSKSNKS